MLHVIACVALGTFISISPTGWTAELRVVTGNTVDRASVPFTFGGVSNATDSALVVNRDNRIVKTQYGTAFSRESLVGSRHWSYCGGELATGKMGRSCYSGDAVLEQLQCDTAHLRCESGAYAIDFDIDNHMGPKGIEFRGVGDAIIVPGTGVGNSNITVISLKAAPHLRVEIVNNVATVWAAASGVETAGSLALCVVIVIALARITRPMTWICSCQQGFASKTECENHAATAHCSISTVHPRSTLPKNAGVGAALRLSAGLIAAAVQAHISRHEGVIVAEDALGDGIYILAVALIVVFIGASAAMYKGKTPHSEPLWSHLAYDTCELLLLTALAYSIPRSYGQDIVVAILFLTGVVGSAVIGRGCLSVSAYSLDDFQLLAAALVVSALFALIVSAMLFPMLVASSGTTHNTAWAVSLHLAISIATAPAATNYAQQHA
jgi:hypothetical protein